MLRKLLLASAAAAAMIGSAMAADLPSRKGPPVAYEPPVPMFTWTGFYLGVNAGFGGDRFRYPLTAYAFGVPVATGTASITSSGVIGGGQVGLNYQVNQLVFGVEADFQGANIRGAVNANIGPFSASAGSRLDYLGTVRGRLGWAFMDRFMVYGTGGFAYGSTNSFVNANLGPVAFNATRRLNQYGYAVGGGVEYAFTPNWSLKTEYLYVDLRNGGNNNNMNLATIGGGAAALTLGLRSSEHIVRAGLNYRFGWGGVGGPVVARY